MTTAQTTSRPQIAAVEPFEAPIVMVECIWVDTLNRSDSARFFPERDAARANLKDTIEDIRSGEIENVHAVYEVGRTFPITEDVAREILDLELSEHGKISEHLERFVTNALGVPRVLNAEYHDRVARSA